MQAEGGAWGALSTPANGEHGPEAFSPLNEIEQAATPATDISGKDEHSQAVFDSGSLPPSPPDSTSTNGSGTKDVANNNNRPEDAALPPPYALPPCSALPPASELPPASVLPEGAALPPLPEFSPKTTNRSTKSTSHQAPQHLPAFVRPRERMPTWQEIRIKKVTERMLENANLLTESWLSTFHGPILTAAAWQALLLEEKSFSRCQPRPTPEIIWPDSHLEDHEARFEAVKRAFPVVPNGEPGPATVTMCNKRRERTVHEFFLAELVQVVETKEALDLARAQAAAAERVVEIEEPDVEVEMVRRKKYFVFGEEEEKESKKSIRRGKQPVPVTIPEEVVREETVFDVLDRNGRLPFGIRCNHVNCRRVRGARRMEEEATAEAEVLARKNAETVEAHIEGWRKYFFLGKGGKKSTGEGEQPMRNTKAEDGTARKSIFKRISSRFNRKIRRKKRSAAKRASETAVINQGAVTQQDNFSVPKPIKVQFKDIDWRAEEEIPEETRTPHRDSGIDFGSDHDQHLMDNLALIEIFEGNLNRNGYEKWEFVEDEDSVESPTKLQCTKLEKYLRGTFAAGGEVLIPVHAIACYRGRFWSLEVARQSQDQNQDNSPSTPPTPTIIVSDFDLDSRNVSPHRLDADNISTKSSLDDYQDCSEYVHPDKIDPDHGSIKSSQSVYENCTARRSSLCLDRPGSSNDPANPRPGLLTTTSLPITPTRFPQVPKQARKIKSETALETIPEEPESVTLAKIEEWKQENKVNRGRPRKRKSRSFVKSIFGRSGSSRTSRTRSPGEPRWWQAKFSPWESGVGR